MLATIVEGWLKLGSAASTLRFFGENILSDAADNDPGTPGVQTVEKVDPTTIADGIAIKFDGIGSSEDLIVLLDLIDSNGSQTTRAGASDR